MLTQEQFVRIRRAMPVLEHANTQLVSEFLSDAFYAQIPAGRDVFVEGDRVEAIALLISGVVRVYKIGETGREITLYRFGLGQSCILTANAILSQKTFPAIATVEKDAQAVMVPARSLRAWVKKYDLWREFVFDLLSDRLLSVLEVVDEVVFQRMDRRLAAWLIRQSGQQNPVQVTHQEIAADLGSSREVISRILEDLSQRGWVEVGRRTVRIVDLAALTAMAEL